MLVVATIALPAAGSAQTTEFEGALTMRVSAPTRPGATGQGAAGQEIEYLVRGGKARVNMGPVSVLAVPSESKLYMLMAAQSAYMEMPMNAAADMARGAEVPDTKITRTGRMETIAGVSCEHVTVTSAKETVDVCLAKGMGGYINPMSAMQSGAPAGWQRLGGAEYGFPLKVTMPDGTIPLEVTRIERKRLAADLFSVPLTYTKMDMPRRR
jgi:hypothetical protein